ncbi:GNAT family N-acetyltransferase [Tetragenococcus koreensis]|uniref:GNAT family N-acetyltransferase n=1 Tax=Tetragenococcus koreensis TaxID=290335 RepID=UPI000F4DBB43|nr:GNAT family N-acetyltransferase [Tetragenococcus koreensis]AYW46860.1 GNAT family N-acetyltransferase [Tetragenococcus koreensis]MCF1585036.1 GNAT family N-acetyltransferase [Tetragenococcus koreensis]MCF1614599.1 GNAT family N-acetyltransferase [Tetragenococcus koreensis]MCF1617124.1 GNAT family N-acetyltransferase [Tetragenococcus koreensis]MCF1619423.1 GNAT family N-acetyltransferase [Tetragenococcus koreensis]
MEIQKLHKVVEKHYDLLLEADPSKKIIDDYLPRSFCFTAQEEGQLVGVIILLPTRPTTLEVVNLAVQKDFRGQKIGQTLLYFALTFAKENQYEVVEVGTGSTGFEQLYLYQKCGFRMSHIERDFFINHYEQPIFENGLQLKDMVRLSQAV